MEMQTLINFTAGAVLSGLLWFAKELWNACKELRADLHSLEVNLPENYVKKIDLDSRMMHIENMFQRIYDKLENKADKE